jgi:cytochrome P450
MIAATGASRPIKPPGYPVVGHLPAYLRDRLGFLLSCDDGSGRPVRLRLAGTAYLLTDAADVEHVLLRNLRNYTKTPRLTGTRGRRLLGGGLLTRFGDEHLERRRMLQPVFSRRRMGDLASVVADVADELTADWQDGAVIDVGAEMTTLSRRVILRTLLGRHPNEAELERALEVRQRYIEYRFGSVFPLPEYVPRPIVVAHRRARLRIVRSLRSAIETRRASDGARADLLGQLVAARAPDGARLSDNEVLEEALVLSVTGYETMAVALAWTWYLVAQHPDVEARLHREVDGIRDERPQAEDLAALGYVEATLNEAMRLYPPTWIFVRIALGPDRLPSGVEIPAGAKLYLSQYVVHRSGRYFRHPARFDPSRFEPAARSSHPEFAYFPFGGGVRLCIGKPLAMLEGVVTLASIARRYRLALEPGPPVTPHPGVTLRPREPVQLRVRAR